MIQIKPSLIKHDNTICENCNSKNITINLIWQGIHICREMKCKECHHHIVNTLPIGHDTYFPSKIDMNKKRIEGNPKVYKWLSEPLMNSLIDPSEDEKINIDYRQKRKFGKIIIVNCIDYLYGHSLLKLLNAERENKNKNTDTGIVVLIQKPFEWMVPDFVDEIWTVNIPFNKARSYYKHINDSIAKQIENYSEVYLSNSYSHPNSFDMKNFIKLENENEKNRKKRITFIWREDRIWNSNFYISKIIQKYPSTKKWFTPYIYIQKNKIVKMFKILNKNIGEEYIFTIVGLGDKTTFPSWIEDERTMKFDEKAEYKISEIYERSEVVIGVHGSNMLIPSALANMTINIMPTDRWGNFSQDILYQEKNARVASYKTRYIPIETSVKTISHIIVQQIKGFDHFLLQMTEDLHEKD